MYGKIGTFCLDICFKTLFKLKLQIKDKPGVGPCHAGSTCVVHLDLPQHHIHLIIMIIPIMIMMMIMMMMMMKTSKF